MLGANLLMVSGVVDCTHVDNAVRTGVVDTHTFAGRSLGAAASNRYIVVVAGGVNQLYARTLSSVTIAGVAATIVETTGNYKAPAVIAIAAVPTGTTGDIVLTFSGVIGRTGIGVYRLTGIKSATPTATAQSLVAAGNVLSASLAIPNGGCGIGYAVADGAAARTWTWTGLTENFDETMESTMTYSGAMSVTQGTADRSATASGTIDNDEEALVLAAWR